MDKTGLVWFRNDLRIEDQKSLFKASQKYNSIIGVFCFDSNWFKETEYGFKKTEKFRAQFLIESVQELKNNLSKLNIPLFVYLEHPVKAIPKLCELHNCIEIFYQKEWTQEESDTELHLINKLPNLTFTSHYDQFLFEPNQLPMGMESLPEVFTEFRKIVQKKCKVNPCTSIDAFYTQTPIINPTKIPSLIDLGLDSFEVHSHSAFPFQGGENQAQKRMQSYFWESNKLSVYKKTRNGLLGTNYSSKFSSWLANGCISAKAIYHEIKKYEKEVTKNDSTYWLIFELIWRDYFKYISLKHQNNIFKLGGIKSRDYEWKNNAKYIKAWMEGNTGKYFVDANMRELHETGWMSNRGRQNVASFFAKDWKLDWRIGAAYFESMLIDYDVHSNYGNWMYVSGVGNDPRDRKFNVELQAERYDPKNKFQQTWLQKTLF